MCVYKSFLVTKDNHVHWYWDDSHDVRGRAMKLDDTKPLSKREFVAIECAGGVIENYHVDEEGTLPRWFKDNRVHGSIMELLPQINARKPEFDAVNAKWKPEYHAVNAKWNSELDAVYVGLPGYITEILDN